MITLLINREKCTVPLWISSPDENYWPYFRSSSLWMSLLVFRHMSFIYLFIFVFKALGGFEICTNNCESWLMKTSRSVHGQILYLSVLTNPIDVRELWIENCESHATRGLLQTLQKRAWAEASSKSVLTFLLLALFIAKTPGLLSGNSPAAGGMAGQGRGNTVWQGKGGKEASCCPLS